MSKFLSTLPPPKPGALMEAVQNNDLNTVKRLLLQNADVNERDYSGNTVLHRAATFGHTEIARALLEKGASINSRNPHGDTPLIAVISASASSSRDGVIQMLLAKGADMTIKNNDGDTAMTLAQKRGRGPVVDMLKETAATRKRLADEFARAAEAKKRATIAERQQRLRDAAQNKPKLKLGPKPPKAA